MIAVKVPLKNAETVKSFLMFNDLFRGSHTVTKDKSCIYFPIKIRDPLIKRKFPSVSFVNKNFKRIERSKPKDALKKILSRDEFDLVGSSFDVVGSILILELPKELVKKEKEIARAFLKLKNIKTVVKKIGGHKGMFRLQKYEFLAGINNKETIHKENGVLIKLNIEKTYFSPRSASERLRIARLVKPGEGVLVMFSGCAPYVLVIAKNSKPKAVYGIELNKDAHDYGLQNIALNKLKNAFLFNGDVRCIMPKINKKFDRIVMPLPKTSQDFLGLALRFVKEKGIIHFYDFSDEKAFPESSIKKIKKVCKKVKKKFKILNAVKCGQSSPKEYRVCIDFTVLN